MVSRTGLAFSERDVDVLNTGVDSLVLKLNNLFTTSKGRRQISACHNLYNHRRFESVSMKDFIAEFKLTYFFISWRL